MIINLDVNYNEVKEADCYYQVLTFYPNVVEINYPKDNSFVSLTHGKVYEEIFQVIKTINERKLKRM